MSRSSARRGQAEPLAALAAVLVLGAALAMYADAVADAAPPDGQSDGAGPTLQRVHDAVTRAGTAIPERIPDAAAVSTRGREVNVTLVAGDRRWSAGPTPPAGASTARRRTPVRIDRWTHRPGWLQVVVWS